MPKAPANGEREMVHVRLDAKLVRAIDHLAVDWRLYRNEAMERLLKEAITKYE
ncbi:MAG: ribbon-helix-helix protein, CopG family [Dehalococcoidia bacterium]